MPISQRSGLALARGRMFVTGLRSARTRRTILIQAAALLAVVALLGLLAANTVTNIARLNINTGFGFMARPAGFDIAQKLIGYSEASTYFEAFLAALLNTVVLAAVSIVFATVLGFIIGLARLSSNQLVAGVAAGYVEIVRNIPLLLQLFYWYFAVLRPLPPPRQSFDLFGMAFLNNRGLLLPAPVPEAGFRTFALTVVGCAVAGLLLWWMARRRRTWTGRGLPYAGAFAALLVTIPLFVAWLTELPVSWEVPELAGFNFRGGVAVIPEFVAMTIALSLYGASYIAEIVRAGVAAVPTGQIEAARALGMRKGAIRRNVVIPLALRVILPPLGTQYILVLKNSSLAAAIAYPDLMLIFAGTVLNQTGQPLEVMLITMGTYLILCLGIGAAVNLANRRAQLVER